MSAARAPAVFLPGVASGVVPPPPMPFPGWTRTSRAERAVKTTKEPKPAMHLAESFKKTQACRFYPQCHKGDACKFAHRPEELRSRPNMSKTRMCAGFYDGRCKLSPDACSFAHGEHELRKREVPYFGPLKAAGGDDGHLTPTTASSPASSSWGQITGRGDGDGTTTPGASSLGSDDRDSTPRAAMTFEKELRSRPNTSKTRMCAGFYDGRCRLSPEQCSFAHGEHELRAREVPYFGPLKAGGGGGHLTPTTGSSPASSVSGQRFAGGGGDGATDSGASSLGSDDGDSTPRAAMSCEQDEEGSAEADHSDSTEAEATFAEWMKQVRAMSGMASNGAEAGGRWPTQGECLAVLLKAMPESYED